MTATPAAYLGSYRLLKLVYKGEASRMWQAYDDGARKFVGIKTLAPEFRHRREWVKRLKYEAEVGKTLDHPNVIRVLDFCVEQGSPYVAMEWFPAPNMRSAIGQGLTRDLAILPKVIFGATEALAHFHERGWLHRDVKPENYLVDGQGTVKLIDFSLAQRVRGGIGRLFGRRTKPQGTRSYMSPEQIRNQALDERSDLYSLGCTLFHLIAGCPPFAGSDTKDLFRKHLSAAPPSLAAAHANVTPAFSSLLRQTMGKRPADRPESTRHFLAALREIPLFEQPGSD